MRRTSLSQAKSPARGLRVGLAQINSVLGDFAANRLKILEFAERARDKKCDLVVFPELSLFGYLPADLLERRSIVDEQLRELTRLAREFPEGVAGLVGAVTPTGKKLGKPFFNSAALIVAGRKPRFFHKELLPTYDVFDEGRHMGPGRIRDNHFLFKGRRIQLTICEDVWGWELPENQSNYLENPLASVRGPRPDLVINMSASPFTAEKEADRETVVARTARHFRAPLVYVNMVGGQDEIIFDGGSFAVGPTGKPFARCARFVEDLNVVDVEARKGGTHAQRLEPVEAVRQALVLGLRDFARKAGLERAHLGLSGGIDSALVACLAVDAFGPSRVACVTMPGPFSSAASRKLAQKLAKNLGVKVMNAPIETTYEVALEALNRAFGDSPFGVMNENLQSRIRGLFLMAYANKENSLLLTTGNKSEYATGYATLYGDMCGGLAPIADLLKDDVYSLCRAYNGDSEIIPREIIDRAPTAELRPNQTDQDSLPPYPDLDGAVRSIVEFQRPARNGVEEWLLGAMARSEFKRWQAPPVLKVKRHSFGRGRRMPIANRARK